MPTRASGTRAGVRPERGIATVWAVSWILVCSMMGWLGMLAAAITARQHHLDGSADLVALSGAARLERGGDPCAVAQQIAEANAVALTSCVVDGDDVMVTVSGDMSLPFGIAGDMQADARAGP